MNEVVNEEYTHFEENGVDMGSTSYWLGGDDYINYVFAIVTPGENEDGEEDEDAISTIVKIVDIEII